jgi:hypothetical protein
MSSQLSLPILVLIMGFQAISPGYDFAQNQSVYVSSRQDTPQSTMRVLSPSSDKAEAAPKCETTRTKAIAISCTYAPSLRAASGPKNVDRIVLNHAEVSFEPNHESQMLVELEFTNEGKSIITSAPTVYLVIDDDSGRNVVRRSLSHVDLARLHVGERLTYSERFLVGAFLGGRYTISLYIPDPEPSHKNIPTFNMLLSSAGVPDPTTGLNTVARFSVKQSMHSPRDK